MVNNKEGVIRDSEYVSPKELCYRWQVSRNTVVRIAREQGFTVFYPGNKQRSSVRYLREEVVAYEKLRQITLKR